MVYFITGYMKLVNLETFEKNVFYMVATMCIYINHASNFFCYVLANKPFRNLLWKKVRRSESTAAPSSYYTHTTTFRTVSSKPALYETIKLTEVTGGCQWLPRVSIYDTDRFNFNSDSWV